MAAPRGPGSRPNDPAPTVRHQLVDPQGRPSAEVRREVEEARGGAAAGKPGPPRARSLDEILGILGELKVQEQLYREGKLNETEPEPEIPRPKPRSAPQPQPKPAAAVPPKPTPRPAAAVAPAAPDEDPYDDDPGPLPPVNRSPAAASAVGSLDDLFGSGEPRVKIGRRTSPKPKPDGSG